MAIIGYDFLGAVLALAFGWLTMLLLTSMVFDDSETAGWVMIFGVIYLLPVAAVVGAIITPISVRAVRLVFPRYWVDSLAAPFLVPVLAGVIPGIVLGLLFVLVGA